MPACSLIIQARFLIVRLLRATSCWISLAVKAASRSRAVSWMNWLVVASHSSAPIPSLPPLTVRSTRRRAVAIAA